MLWPMFVWNKCMKSEIIFQFIAWMLTFNDQIKGIQIVPYMIMTNDY